MKNGDALKGAYTAGPGKLALFIDESMNIKKLWQPKELAAFFRWQSRRSVGSEADSLPSHAGKCGEKQQ